MDLHYRTLFKIMGLILEILGFSMALPLITALAYGETDSAWSFAYVMIPCIALGFLQFKFIKPSNKNLKLRDGFLIVALAWLMVSAISAIPMVLDGSIPSYFDSFFEMCSGYTTTGATVVEDIEALPKAVLMHRAFSHWLGGMGVLVFAIALLPSLGISGQEIVEAETPGPVLSKLTPKMNDTAKYLYYIYITFTVAELFLLLLGGMSFFDGITHSFSTVGTGGFSNYNDSIAHFDSVYIDFVICVFMIAASINFNLFYLFLKDGKIQFFKDQECKYYLMIIGAFSLAMALFLYFSDSVKTPLSAIHHGVFQVTSIISTTGFSTTDFGAWPSFCLMLLLCLMFVGGSSSSTAGGIKVIRVLIMFKTIRRSIALRLHPSALINIKYNNRILSTDVVQNICAFVFLYGATFFGVSLFVSYDNFDMITNFSAVATCLGNIGPGFGDIGSGGLFSRFSEGMKFVLSLTMIAGRLELFTLLMLFTGKFWNPNE